MIRVEPAPEPVRFDETVRQPGLRAIAELVGELPPRSKGPRHKPVALVRKDIPPDKFPPLWRQCLSELQTAYSYICAYSCFRIHRVTGAASVDHFAAKSTAWNQVYEWHNYRFACSKLNSRKKTYDDGNRSHLGEE